MHSVFNSCDVLKPYVAHIDDIFKDFTSYKVRVPVTGAIILDETYERVSLLGIFIGKVPIYTLYIWNYFFSGFLFYFIKLELVLI